MSTSRASFTFALLALAVMACTVKEEADPPQVAFDVQFPSAQAAAYTENVKVWAFAGGSCADLIRLRQTGQALPAAVAETALITPCQLWSGADNTFDLPLSQEYAFLAVGQVGAKDVFIGCSSERAFGSTKAMPISLTFIDNLQSMGKTTCTKLSDKCAQPARCN